VVAAAQALMEADFAESAMRTSMVSALQAVFEPLRIYLEAVKQKVDVARGLEALVEACVSALELVALRWSSFRGTAQQPVADPFAAAVVARAAQLKQVTGDHD
jgi:hypothetical protein